MQEAFERQEYKEAIFYAKRFISNSKDAFYIGIEFYNIILCNSILAELEGNDVYLQEINKVIEQMDQFINQNYCSQPLYTSIDTHNSVNPGSNGYYNLEIAPLIFAKAIFDYIISEHFISEHFVEDSYQKLETVFKYCGFIIKDFESILPVSEWFHPENPRFIVDLLNAKAYYMVSIKYFNSFDYNKAIILLQKSLDLYERILSVYEEDSVHNIINNAIANLCSCFFFTKDPDKLKSFCQKFDETADEAQIDYVSCLIDLCNNDYKSFTKRVKKYEESSEENRNYDVFLLLKLVYMIKACQEGLIDDSSAYVHYSNYLADFIPKEQINSFITRFKKCGYIRDTLNSREEESAEAISIVKSQLSCSVNEQPTYSTNEQQSYSGNDFKSNSVRDIEDKPSEGFSNNINNSNNNNNKNIFLSDVYNRKITELKAKYNKLSVYSEKHELKGIYEKLQSKLQDLNEPLYIMIVGNGKHGKSTLINALIGKNVAEVARVPKTWKIDIFQFVQN